jgi:hypothetical protein
LSQKICSNTVTDLGHLTLFSLSCRICFFFPMILLRSQQSARHLQRRHAFVC